ncbi:hypothetical protein H4R18_002144 [Coemansia javaensis]|uniref:SMP-LTD domain-containing protein n=1 Tax=Coemansia javaensis TaxID=2761396 RepID=A0A9W8LJK9_9FUNG|nr:hypothetical protein H4R18_002144 [Coemansia javaensis]
MSFGILLLTYALGVLTVPALVAAGVLVFWLGAPSELEEKAARSTPAVGRLGGAQPAGAAPLPFSQRRAGWLHIARTLGQPPGLFDGQMKLADMVTRGIAKWIQGKRPDDRPAAPAPADGAQGLYYVVLDGDTLVMYDGEAMGECRGVIIMSKHRVSLRHRKDVTESQVYSRRTPIRLSPVNDDVETDLCRGQVAEYYIYADRPSDKEDWYFALLWSSLEFGALERGDGDRPAGYMPDAAPGAAGEDEEGEEEKEEGGEAQTRARAAQQQPPPQPHLTGADRERMRLSMRRSCMVPDYAGIRAILETISKRGAGPGAGAVSSDEWLNAIVGRIFLGTYRTERVRRHFIHKMQTKFDRVQRPAFLDRVVVADLDVGDHVPVITNPRLESFDANGQVDTSMYMHYMGGFRLVLNTAVKLGALRLSISLAVVLQSLAGKMLLRFKPAPSNRFWLAFYEEPRISLKISPVFMQKQVKYAAVSQAIEKQIHDMLRLTLVLPHMDDTVFFPAAFEDGGILEQSLKDYADAGLDKAGRPGEEDAGQPAVRGTAPAPRRNSSTPRPSMSTPTAISDSSPGSSAESLPRGSPAGAGPGGAPHSPTLSEAAAQWFKRAKGSQAAESARSWWQNLQQGGTTSTSSASTNAATSTGDRLQKRRSGVFSGPAAAAPDSLLVRRRPAAQSHSSDAQQPARRRPPRPASTLRDEDT